MIAVQSKPKKGWTQITLSSWVCYTFRVVSIHDVGNSTPSALPLVSKPTLQVGICYSTLKFLTVFILAICFSLKEYEARHFRLEGNNLTHGCISPVPGSP